ncbi:hypothetical protein EIN_492920, partial [Entamoeba invadens IP1]
MCEFSVHFLHGFCDKDNDKLVSKEELFPFLFKYLKIKEGGPGSGFQSYLFDLCDLNQNGKLDITEFIHLMTCLEVFETCREYSDKLTLMMVLFKAMDSDGNGRLDSVEIKNAILKLEKTEDPM